MLPLRKEGKESTRREIPPAANWLLLLHPTRPPPAVAGGNVAPGVRGVVGGWTDGSSPLVVLEVQASLLAALLALRVGQVVHVEAHQAKGKPKLLCDAAVHGALEGRHLLRDLRELEGGRGGGVSGGVPREGKRRARGRRAPPSTASR